MYGYESGRADSEFRSRPDDKGLIPSDRIERAILFVRGQKVMLDRDLAGLYGVTTKALNQAVWRPTSCWRGLSQRDDL